MVRLILASGSPRRHELVSLLGIPFDSVTPDVRESAASGENARETAFLLARMKAQAVASTRPGTIIVGADTVVVLHGRVMGKPADAPSASVMLHALRGQEHQVISGLAVLDATGGTATVQTVESRVWMRDYQGDEIADYIARGEPFDKAGGYAIQDRLFHPVARIEGCYANVMGLPLCHLYRALKQMGLTLPASPRPACDIHSGRRCLVAERILDEGVETRDDR
jgi:MAF protein